MQRLQTTKNTAYSAYFQVEMNCLDFHAYNWPHNSLISNNINININRLTELYD